MAVNVLHLGIVHENLLVILLPWFTIMEAVVLCIKSNYGLCLLNSTDWQQTTLDHLNRLIYIITYSRWYRLCPENKIRGEHLQLEFDGKKSCSIRLSLFIGVIYGMVC